MRKLLTSIFVVLTLGLLSSSALAGHYKLEYDPKGTLDLDQATDGGCDVIDITLLPATGDRRGGAAELRIDGMPYGRKDGAPYYWTIPIREGGTIPAYRGVGNKDYQANLRDITLDAAWFRRKHLVEVYFLTVDNNNRSSKDKSDAPGRLFWFTPDTTPDNVAQPVSKNQLDAGLADAYKKGVQDATNSLQAVIDQMKAEMQRLSDELTEVKRNKIAPTNTVCQRCSGVLQSPPYLDDRMVGQVYVVSDHGTWVTEARVVRWDASTRRAHFEMLLPVGVETNPDWHYTWKKPGGK